MASSQAGEDEFLLRPPNGILDRSKSVTSQPLKLLNLPNELLRLILTLLDNRTPSENNFVGHPTSSWTVSQDHPLKNVSVLSHRLRSLVLPLLFCHARLDPYRLSPFLEFVRQNELSEYIVSIVANLQGPCSHFHPAWWCRLLNEIPATCFTISCAPHVFAEIAKVSMNMNDSWAFDIPYQLLELRQSPEAARQHVSYNKLPSVLTARPWHSLRVNEGSNLSAYSSYEYFLKKPPSIMANMGSQFAPLHVPNPPNPALQILEGLTEFSFIAIFPFYNHVDDILKCVRRMKSLETLFMKLCPEPESTILEDEMKAANYHIDLNDPWTEFNTSYRLVAHAVRSLGAAFRLQRFVVDDFKMTGVWDSVETTISDILDVSWVYKGQGTWSKQAPSLPAVPSTEMP